MEEAKYIDGFYEHLNQAIPILITLKDADQLAVGVHGSFHATQQPIPTTTHGMQIIYVVEESKFNVQIPIMDTSELQFEVHSDVSDSY